MKNDDKQVLLDVKNLKKYFDVGNKKILKAVDDVYSTGKNSWSSWRVRLR